MSRHRTYNQDQVVSQYQNSISDIEQRSKEAIFVLNSKDITVTSTDTKVAASLQVALQVAIAIVINISIADSERAKEVTEELLGFSRIEQASKQLIVVDGSESVSVSTTDTDVAASIQVLLQILIALVGQLNLF